MVNRVLARFDIAATRRTTLDRTRFELNRARVELESLKTASAAMQMQMSSANQLRQGRETYEQALSEMNRELIRHQIAAKWNVVDAIGRAGSSTMHMRTCPLCQHRDNNGSFRKYTSNCIFGGGVLERYQCPACDVIFGADKMLDLSDGELSQEYEWHYKVYEEGDSTEAELRAFHSLEPKRDGIYVNYGAGGWSRTVKVLREDGWNVFAYEPHSSASTAGEWVISSEAEMAKHRFDRLFSNNVLEHLRHPVEDFQRMQEWLKPGARMAHATPCYEYLYEYTRFHLFFFLGRSRQLLAERAGLSIQSHEVDGHFMNCVFSPQAS